MTESCRWAGIRSLALHFPQTIRTNDYFRQNYPKIVEQVETSMLAKQRGAKKINAFSEESQLWIEAMKPHRLDPFQGAIHRRVVSAEDSTLSMGCAAAIKALDAANLHQDEIDLIISCSIFPNHLFPGDAAFLAQKLDIKAPAWNLDATCATASVAYQTASALIKTGEFRNILVVMSAAYTRFSEEKDPFSWWLGDGAGAFIVSLQPEGLGILGTKFINTAETCNTFFTEINTNTQGKPQFFIRARPNAGQKLRDTTVQYVRRCCEGAVEAAQLSLDQIDFFIFPTPKAWYTEVCSKALGIDRSRTISVNPHYANIGPVLPIANLHHAIAAGQIQKNDLVLIYAIGSVSSAGAMVIRWGDVALGNTPIKNFSQKSLVSIG